MENFIFFTVYNHGHNILRLFDAWPKLFTTSETKRDYK